MASITCFRGVKDPKKPWDFQAHGYDEIVDRLKSKLEEESTHIENERYWKKDGPGSIFKMAAKHQSNDSAALKEYFIAFSKIFFQGLLTFENCPLRFVRIEGPTAKDWTELSKGINSSIRKGFTDDNRYKCLNPATMQAPITILENPNQGSRAILRDYVGTLLHEMIHAFFHIFACGCLQCDQEPMILTDGETGHGLPFMKLGLCFEEYTRLVLDLVLSLGLPLSFATELYKSDTSDSEINIEIVGMQSYHKEQISGYLQYFSNCTSDYPSYPEYAVDVNDDNKLDDSFRSSFDCWYEALASPADPDHNQDEEGISTPGPTPSLVQWLHEFAGLEAENEQHGSPKK